MILILDMDLGYYAPINDMPHPPHLGSTWGKCSGMVNILMPHRWGLVGEVTFGCSRPRSLFIVIVLFIVNFLAYSTWGIG